MLKILQAIPKKIGRFNEILTFFFAETILTGFSEASGYLRFSDRYGVLRKAAKDDEVNSEKNSKTVDKNVPFKKLIFQKLISIIFFQRA